jgi:hypothetical protein
VGIAEDKAAAAKDVCCTVSCYHPATRDCRFLPHTDGCTWNDAWMPLCDKHARIIAWIGVPCVECHGYMQVGDHREHLPGKEWT